MRLDSPAPLVPTQIPLIPMVVTPKLRMLTINLPTYDGTGHVYDFLEKFHNFGITHGLAEQAGRQWTFCPSTLLTIYRSLNGGYNFATLSLGCLSSTIVKSPILTIVSECFLL